jgi:vancomycin permeability regulator SanA
MNIHIQKKVRIVFRVLLSWFLLHMLYISVDGLHADQGKADIAIVMGNPVNADSSLSPWLEGRVDKARELYEQGRVKKIFVSGGPGAEGVAEGDAMKSWLLKKGIPAGDIISDNQGRNTFFTAKDFMRLNDSCQFSSAMIVTSFYHVTRSKYILRKLGFRKVKASASTRYFINDAFGMAREFPAFYEYMLLY